MNMAVKKRVAIPCAAMSVAACLALGAGAAEKAKFEAQRIREHVKYLASDELEGRGMGQKGGELAAQYFAKEFAKYGLQPAGDSGTYFQTVPMVGVKTTSGTTFELAPKVGEAIPLKLLDDIVTTNETQTKSVEIDAPIVFVGYGIKAPEYQWDDYKGYDLKGKVALLFVNEPVSDDPKFFKGKALTYYGRWTYKFEETARRGAVATLIIHRTDLASYGWSVVRNSWGTEKSFLKLDGTPKLQAASWITTEVAGKLAAMNGTTVDKMFEEAQSREFKPVELPVRLKAHVVSELRPFDSKNVVAKLPGTDAKLKDEAILYTAHYDHFGIDPMLKTADKIYNGAVDNATGCGILLEMARVWANSPAPKRSVLFAAVTAEEQGLLGSEYFGKHPTVPASKISLDLNYDALAPRGEPEEVEVSGAERTTFYPVVEAAAKEFHLAIKPDAQPEAGHYYRSDHFSLARVGIPSFSISQGMKFKGHDTGWGEAQAKDYTDHCYHQVTDEFREDWDFRGLAKMAEFGFELGMKAANQPSLVEWQKGDEFEAARKASFAASLNGTSLFKNSPDLHLLESVPLRYPPLARATRVFGDVELHVTVSMNGEVTEVTVVSGHPLLQQSALDAVRAWKFAPLNEPKQFDVVCTFAFTDTAKDYGVEEFSVVGPQHIIVSSEPPVMQTIYSRVRS